MDSLREHAELLARSATAAEIDLLSKGTSLEAAVRRAMEAGDRKILAVHLEKLLRALPEREAAARAKAAMLASPAAVLLLDKVVALMLHPRTSPDELREAAARIEETLPSLK